MVELLPVMLASVWVSVHPVAALLSIQFPAGVPGSVAEDDSGVWIPDTHMRDLVEAPSSWL